MEKVQRGSAIVTIIIVVVAMSIVSAVTWILATKIEVTSQKTEVTKVPVATQQVPASESQQSALTGKKAASELVSVDADWNLYTNNNLGFSMKVPKMNYDDMQCIKDKSVVVVSDDVTGRLYIGTKDVYSNEKEKCYPFSFTLFDGELKGNQHDILGGAILFFATLKNEVPAIDSFLAKQYDSKCVSNKKLFVDGKITIQDYVKFYDNANPINDGSCWLNWEIFSYYSNAKQKIVIVDLGQSPRFLGKNEDYGKIKENQTIQNQMFSSFKFE